MHRCLQRHGISRLPEIAGDKPARQPFKRYAIGYFHIDIAEVRTEEGKLYLFVAVDRTAKYAFARLVKKATGAAARAFLEELVAAVPFRIHTVLTDNGIQFADLPKNRDGATASWRGHPFDRACLGHRIEHRLTKPNHPWTNGQVERMNRTLKEATVRRYHYETHGNWKITSLPSLMLTTSPDALRPCVVSHPMKLSAKHGPTNQTASGSIPST
ncbi:transposase InsO family protein [Bradyrhizobium elkanii]|nr:transposase InsO family protein [Bradyrhizobium elkanii]MCS3561502.1 transposase InsO family protein [Bradyrhizobium elkanii]MCW2148656.1 transposase InsO family protein [Bradyrhizobium elkanii]MCW2352257.1 transposase InsO family protein [Bradyrhizobium elkanii]MCW2372385.1 transposase InsO family protein [Bradyrhizobium elkanii]